MLVEKKIDQRFRELAGDILYMHKLIRVLTTALGSMLAGEYSETACRGIHAEAEEFLRDDSVNEIKEFYDE